MDLFAIGFGIFIATVLIIQLVMYGVGHMRTIQRVKIRKRLRKLTVGEIGPDGAEILKKRALSDKEARSVYRDGETSCINCSSRTLHGFATELGLCSADLAGGWQDLCCEE